MKRLTTLLVLLLLSCGGNQEEQKVIKNTNKEPELSKPKTLIIELEIETDSPEDFKLIANDIFLNNGQSMDLYITQRINPNETSKKIRFELPDNIVPDFNIGISLGTKKEKEVKINNVDISIGSLSYQINSNNLITYFRPNKFVDYDDESGALKTKTVDGKHNPMIFLRKRYVDKIESSN